MYITLLYSLHITSLYIRENNDGYQRTKEMRLRNKHDRDKSWDNQDNIPPMIKKESKDDRILGTMKYPTQEEIIAFNRKENKQKDIDKRIEYLKSEIHSNHNDGYVKEGLTKELKTLWNSQEYIDSIEDNPIDNNDDETYGATFGMSY